MITNGAADGAAPELLEGRFAGVAPQSGFSDEFWSLAMRKNKDSVQKRVNASASTEPVCGRLRVLFDDVAAQPMPDQLASLADRLQIALERGELFDPKSKPAKG